MLLSLAHPLLVDFNFEFVSTNQRFEYFGANRRFKYVLDAGFAGIYFQRIYVVNNMNHPFIEYYYVIV